MQSSDMSNQLLTDINAELDEFWQLLAAESESGQAEPKLDDLLASVAEQEEAA